MNKRLDQFLARMVVGFAKLLAAVIVFAVIAFLFWIDHLRFTL